MKPFNGDEFVKEIYRYLPGITKADAAEEAARAAEEFFRLSHSWWADFTVPLDAEQAAVGLLNAATKTETFNVGVLDAPESEKIFFAINNSIGCWVIYVRDPAGVEEYKSYLRPGRKVKVGDHDPIYLTKIPEGTPSVDNLKAIACWDGPDSIGASREIVLYGPELTFDDSNALSVSDEAGKSKVRLEWLRYIVATESRDGEDGATVELLQFPLEADFVAGAQGRGLPQRYRWSESEARIEFDSMADRDYTIRGSAVVRPTPDADNGLPDLVHDRHRRDIVHGAVAELYGIPGKPWTSEMNSSKFRRMFHQAINRERGARLMSRPQVAVPEGPLDF